jgi:peptide/nickel transport system substrate-binding protein
VRRLRLVTAVAVTVALGVAACSSPSSNNGGGNNGGGIEQQNSVFDPNAKGPAPEVPGAKKGGTLTVYSESTPETLDPTATYYTDSNEIEKLYFRTPTQFRIKNDGNAVLVPDLTDLGTVSADKLTWTFKMKGSFKYSDGSDVKVEDLAYAIKRSFDVEAFSGLPTYQLTYFKDGDKYKGPYKDKGTYSGVETPDANTLVIHLAKAFPDLPLYMTFPLFTPIPEAKDTKDQYQNNPLATGPYMVDSYTKGTELKLKKNPYWKADTDAARHQYVDAWDFKWGQEDLKTQQSVLNSKGDDANAVNYRDVDASLVKDVTGAKKDQLVTGPGPCTFFTQMDSRKIPLEVRKAIAKAYPYDQIYTAAGLSDLIAQPASTIMSPTVPGYKKYTPLPDLAGTGKGDPDGAKAMLQAAGKLGFEVSWYYDNTKTVPQQVSQARADALTKAGFTVKPIGVTTAELRKKVGDYKAPVNLGQSPRGWCSDWPSGSTWFPVLFHSGAIDTGTAWGMIEDKSLDAEMDAVAALPPTEAASKWAAIDEKIMGMYLGLPLYYTKTALVIGTNVGGGGVDGTQGMPNVENLFLKTGS